LYRPIGVPNKDIIRMTDGGVWISTEISTDVFGIDAKIAV
jgi:hypothetical protein